MGLSQAAGVRMALAAENPKRPPVIWLHFQECTGCTESLLRSYHPTLESLILDVISLDYHDTLCVGAGKQALDYKHKIMEEYRGKYVLVTEGSTPMAEGGIYSKVGGVTQVDLVRQAAEGATLLGPGQGAIEHGGGGRGQGHLVAVDLGQGEPCHEGQ